MSKTVQDDSPLNVGQLELFYSISSPPNNPLFKAVFEGNIEQVRKLLQSNTYNPSDLEAPSPTSSSPLPLLTFAAINGHLEVVRFIVHFFSQQAAHVPTLIRSINISLLFTAIYGHPSVVDYLLNCGGDCNTTPGTHGLLNSRETPILIALSKGHNEVVRILLSGASLDESQILLSLTTGFKSGNRVGIELILDKVFYSSSKINREYLLRIVMLTIDSSARNSAFLPIASQLLTRFPEISQCYLRNTIARGKSDIDFFARVLSRIRQESPLLQQLFDEIVSAQNASNTTASNTSLVKRRKEDSSDPAIQIRNLTIQILNQWGILTGASTINISNLIKKIKEEILSDTRRKRMVSDLKLICPTHPEITLSPSLFNEIITNFNPRYIPCHVPNGDISVNVPQPRVVGLNMSKILIILATVIFNHTEVRQASYIAKDHMATKALDNLINFLQPLVDFEEHTFYIDRMLPLINASERPNHVLVRSGLSSLCITDSNVYHNLTTQIFNRFGAQRLLKLKKVHTDLIIQDLIQYCTTLPEVQKAAEDRPTFANSITAFRKTSDNVISALNACTHYDSGIQQKLKALNELSAFILKTLPSIKEGIKSKFERPDRGRQTRKNALENHTKREQECRSLSIKVDLLHSLYDLLCQQYELLKKGCTRRFINNLCQAENETLPFDRRSRYLSSAQHAFDKFECLLGNHRSAGLIKTRQSKLLPNANYDKQAQDLKKLILEEPRLFDFAWLDNELTTFYNLLDERKRAHESLLVTYHQKMAADSKKEEHDKEKREKDLKAQQAENERRQACEKKRLEDQIKLANELREKHLKWQREQEKRKKEREEANKKLAATPAAAATTDVSAATLASGSPATTSGASTAETRLQSLASTRQMMQRFNSRRAPMVLTLEAKTEFSKKIQESEKQRKLKVLLSGSLEGLVKLISTLSFRADDMKAKKELESPQLSTVARMIERNALFEVLAQTMELIIQLKGHHWFSIRLAKGLRDALYHEKNRHLLQPTEDNLKVIREVIMNVLNLLQGEIPKEAPTEITLLQQIQGNASSTHWLNRLLMTHEQNLKEKATGCIPSCDELKEALSDAQSELDQYVAFENFHPNTVTNPYSGLHQAIQFTRARIGCIIREFCDYHRRELGNFDPDYLAFCYECLYDGRKIRHAKLKEEEAFVHTSALFTRLPNTNNLTPFDRSSFITGFLTQLQNTRRAQEAATAGSTAASATAGDVANTAGGAFDAAAAAAAAASATTRRTTTRRT